MDVDLELVRLASSQRGLIAKRQVLEAGGSTATIKWRLMAGQWQLVRRNVYRIAGSPPTWEQAVLAAVLSCGEGFVASHESGLRLYGGRTAEDSTIELSAERRHRTEAPGIRAHRSFVFFDPDVTVRSGIPVTSAARTVIDLSSRRSAAELGAVVDDLQRRRLLRTVQLVQCAARLR